MQCVALEKEIAGLKQQVADYKQEQKTELKTKLSEAERQELRDLSDRDKALQAEIAAMERDVRQVADRRDKLKADLKNNLQKRKDELTARLMLGGDEGGEDESKVGADLEGEAEIKRLERKHAVAAVVAVEKEVEALESQLEKKRAEAGKLEKAVEQRRAEEQAAQEELDELSKTQDKLINKRTMLMDTVAQKQHMIRELGTLPRKELEEFKTLGEKQVMKKLKEVNEGLKKYASVNRKALDQYVAFNEQRETLVRRKEELTRDTEAIEQLVKSLDAQKEEAIMRTFRGVSFHFTEVFAELVPGGKGQLIMRVTGDGDGDGTDLNEVVAASSSSSSSSSSRYAEITPCSAANTLCM